MSQIAEFFLANKDKAELNMLQHFVSTASIDNFAQGIKGCIAAFSLNAQDINAAFNRILRSQEFLQLTGYDEVYIVGVKID